MPAWRPGRYTIQNYARYVIGVDVVDEGGNSLPFEKTDKNTWCISGGNARRLIVCYRAYASVLDAGESFLDEHEAYINPISVLMYVPGKEFTSSIVAFDKPSDWEVATALDYDEVAEGYVASDYHELVDSPFIISPDLKTFSFDYGGATYELVFQGEPQSNYTLFVEDVERIVRAQVGIMGITPYRRYVFLYHLVPHRFSHGVEHKNSTCIVLGPTDFSDVHFRSRFWEFTAHELFHVWNVERIRPEAIYYPDYSREMYTTTMWVYEGITCYYTDLSLLKAGLYTKDRYLAELGSALFRYDMAAGRNVTSVAMTSWNSWISRKAPPDTTYSFYLAGHVLGLLLDLEVRNRTANRKSLDDVFRYLYAEYAEKDIGVPEEGFQHALEYISGSGFQEFFDRYVFGFDDIDYDTYLVHAGLKLNKTPEHGEGYKIEVCADRTALQNDVYESWLLNTSVII